MVGFSGFKSTVCDKLTTNLRQIVMMDKSPFNQRALSTGVSCINVTCEVVLYVPPHIEEA